MVHQVLTGPFESRKPRLVRYTSSEGYNYAPLLTPLLTLLTGITLSLDLLMVYKMILRIYGFLFKHMDSEVMTMLDEIKMNGKYKW